MGLGCRNHKYSIGKVANGTYSELASAGPISELKVGEWYTVTAVATCSSLQLFVDGVKVLEVQDSSHLNGAVGFRTYDGAMEAGQMIVQSLGWSKTYGGTSEDIAYSVVQTNDGGYALAGYTSSFGAGGNDFWLAKTDSAGNQLWGKTYGGTGDEKAYSVVQTSDDGYVIVGYTNSFGAGSSDFWLVKVPADSPPYTINDYDGLTHTSDVTIKLSATDDFTNVSETYYRINDGSTRTVSINGQPIMNIKGSNNKLEYWSVDSFGHEEIPHKVLTGIKIDETLAKVETPLFTLSGGVYSSFQSVTISCGISEATIRYTTDGSEPTALSAVYSGPISISENCTIRAKAFKNGMLDSDISSATYAFTSSDAFTSSGSTDSEVYTRILSAVAIAVVATFTITGTTLYFVRRKKLDLV